MNFLYAACIGTVVGVLCAIMLSNFLPFANRVIKAEARSAIRRILLLGRMIIVSSVFASGCIFVVNLMPTSGGVLDAFVTPPHIAAICFVLPNIFIALRSNRLSL